VRFTFALARLSRSQRCHQYHFVGSVKYRGFKHIFVYQFTINRNKTPAIRNSELLRQHPHAAVIWQINITRIFGAALRQVFAERIAGKASMTSGLTTVQQVSQWVEQCVIDLSLCPFAGVPYRAGKGRIVVCDSPLEVDFLARIESELIQLLDDPGLAETTLIAAENALPDFLDFNDFLADVEELLRVDDRESSFQVASFHPQYRFAGVDASDLGNYTNRSPFPVVQWLQADSVAKAVASTDTLGIPDANIERLKAMGAAECRQRFPWVKQ